MACMTTSRHCLQKLRQRRLKIETNDINANWAWPKACLYHGLPSGTHIKGVRLPISHAKPLCI